LACGGTGDSHHGQICCNFVMRSCQYGPKFQQLVESVPGQRGSKPASSKVSLIMWHVFWEWSMSNFWVGFLFTS